jgi:hypothetical protein
MKIVNLLPKHLECMRRIGASSLNADTINIREDLYKGYPLIYDYLDQEIFHSDQKPSGIFKNALAFHGLDSLYEITDYWNTHIEDCLLAVQEKIEKFFNHKALIDMTICITIGNTTCNGIQTPFNEGTVFLFVEKLSKENSEALFCHELIHTLHTLIYDGVEDIKLLDVLYMEGIACWFSKMIFAGNADHTYLWLSESEALNDRQFYIQDNAQVILQDLQSNDGKTFGNYLNASQGIEGRPLRIGYDIGLCVVGAMWECTTSLELLKMDVNTARQGFIDGFKKLYFTHEVVV